MRSKSIAYALLLGVPASVTALTASGLVHDGPSLNWCFFSGGLWCYAIPMALWVRTFVKD